MANITTAPIAITPEAAAFTAKLGFRAELDRMIEKAFEVFPEMHRVHVTLEESPEGDDPGVVAWGFVGDLLSLHTRDRDVWVPWFVDAFHPDFRFRFGLSLLDEPNGR